MALWNIVENDTVVNVIIADTVDLVPCDEGQTIEENTGQAFVGYQKINGVWLHPNQLTEISAEPDEEIEGIITEPDISN